MDKETSELLVRVGPNTAMGRLMRRFWVPVLLSEHRLNGKPVREKYL